MTPMHETLRNAVSAAIKVGTDRKSISVKNWASTFPGVTEENVREEWAIALAKVPPNTVEIEVEGK